MARNSPQLFEQAAALTTDAIAGDGTASLLLFVGEAPQERLQAHKAGFLVSRAETKNEEIQDRVAEIDSQPLRNQLCAGVCQLYVATVHAALVKAGGVLAPITAGLPCGIPKRRIRHSL